MNTFLPYCRAALMGLAGFAFSGAAGCYSVSNTPTPGRVVTDREPVHEGKYHLYVPARYTDDRLWPLVVTCHGTVPFDTADFQFTEWKGVAEEKGFLVVAPELSGTSALSPSTEGQIRRQIEDEKRILSIVRTVRASHAVDDARVFLTGWSAGSFAVLFTGLRNPDVFRALAVRQGNFKASYFEPCIPFLDRYQPVMIMFGNIDPLQDEAREAVTWLQSNELDPTVIERPGSHRRDPNPVYSFFVDVLRYRPWIRVHARDHASDPMQVTLSVRTSFEPVRYLWDFGDRQRSTMERPTHRYEQPGLYPVRVAVYPPGKKDPFVRQIQLQVPRVRLGVAGVTSAPAS